MKNGNRNQEKILHDKLEEVEASFLFFSDRDIVNVDAYKHAQQLSTLRKGQKGAKVNCSQEI